MKYKTNMCNNKKYEINDEILIKIKSLNKFHNKNIKLNLMSGSYKIAATYKINKLKNVTLFLPSFISQMYSPNIIAEGFDFEELKFILSSKRLNHPINIKNNFLELFDNGFSIKNKNIKIFPSYFFNQITGLFFDCE